MPTSPKTIVLIENNSLMLELYQRELGKVFRVLAYSDTNNLLNILQAQPISALILATEPLPEKDLKLIRDAKLGAFLPIILCSAQDARKLALEVNAAACLLKPVSPATLLEILDQVFKK